MIIHIIKENEKLNEILNFYNITFDDLKQNNLHITDFKNLKPGMKIKIPNISSNVTQILNSTEPLVSSYYIEDSINTKEESTIDSKADENKAVNEMHTQETNPFFRGVNFIKPKVDITIPKLKKPIYPHFKRNNPK